MPLIRIDVVAGQRSDDQLERLQGAVHAAMVEAFLVPVRDRYQVLQEHRPGRMVVQDTGLDIVRSQAVVLVQVFSRPRPVVQKEALYVAMVRELGDQCGVAPSDVVISIVENTDADWSFGYGRAQFLTGEL